MRAHLEPKTQSLPTSAALSKTNGRDALRASQIQAGGGDADLPSERKSSIGVWIEGDDFSVFENLAGKSGWIDVLERLAGSQADHLKTCFVRVVKVLWNRPCSPNMIEQKQPL